MTNEQAQHKDEIKITDQEENTSYIVLCNRCGFLFELSSLDYIDPNYPLCRRCLKECAHS